ncbi:MAG TPA: hypothetical protein VMV49_13770 [Candidatus Deferrimicrobium sp.]|nr:hypothetical protein [Candidatus Deferrimicrobium sp.]
MHARLFCMDSLTMLSQLQRCPPTHLAELLTRLFMALKRVVVQQRGILLYTRDSEKQEAPLPFADACLQIIHHWREPTYYFSRYAHPELGLCKLKLRTEGFRLD